MSEGFLPKNPFNDVMYEGFFLTAKSNGNQFATDPKNDDRAHFGGRKLKHTLLKLLALWRYVACSMQFTTSWTATELCVLKNSFL